jgi:hypothetical protein
MADKAGMIRRLLSLALLIAASLNASAADDWQDPANARPLQPGLADCAAQSGPERVLPLPRPPTSGSALAEYWRRAGFQRIWGVDDNLVLQTDGSLRLRFPRGSYVPGARDAPRGGAGFLAPLLQGHQARQGCLSYQLRVPADFDFVRGGKLPGLYGGQAPSGGEAVDGHSGFSVRLMWRSGGQLEAYAYVANAPSGRYASIARGAARLEREVWVQLSQEIILNDPQRDDGVVRLWVNGQLVLERRDIAFRRDAKLNIDGLMFSSFFGGNDPGWASPRDQELRFRDFSLRWRSP